MKITKGKLAFVLCVSFFAIVVTCLVFFQSKPNTLDQVLCQIVAATPDPNNINYSLYELCPYYKDGQILSPNNTSLTDIKITNPLWHFSVEEKSKTGVNGIVVDYQYFPDYFILTGTGEVKGKPTPITLKIALTQKMKEDIVLYRETHDTVRKSQFSIRIKITMPKDIRDQFFTTKAAELVDCNFFENCSSPPAWLKNLIAFCPDEQYTTETNPDGTVKISGKFRAYKYNFNESPTDYSCDNRTQGYVTLKPT